MQTVVLATRNPGKIREIEILLTGLPLRVVSLAGLPAGQVGPLHEEGTTYAENAVSKALSVARATGMVALADDSGIEVDAMGGAPGVHSARFLGMEATDEQRNAAILERLHGVPPEERTARFRAVVAVALPDATVRTFEGVVEGLIAEAPAGVHGFGYDPIFLVPDYGRTMAELPPEVKNRISHRARAIQVVKPYLAEIASGGTAEKPSGAP